MIRKAFAVAAAVVGVVGLSHPAPVEATSHRAVRSFSAPWTLPYSAVEVTITATGYGGFGQVVERCRPGSATRAPTCPRPRQRSKARPSPSRCWGTSASRIRSPPQGGGFLFLLRSPAGREQGRASGWRRFQHQGRPRFHAHTGVDNHADSDPTPTPTKEPTPEPTATPIPREPTATPEPAIATPTPTSAPPPSPPVPESMDAMSAYWRYHTSKGKLRHLPPPRLTETPAQMDRRDTITHPLDSMSSIHRITVASPLARGLASCPPTLEAGGRRP